ncbi:MAG: hypothetical protein ABSH48_11655 [Verrucomicrobiota bacterium]
MKEASYNGGVECLTRQERRVLGIVVLLLLMGWLVKTHRAASSPAPKSGADVAPGTVAVPPAKP